MRTIQSAVLSLMEMDKFENGKREILLKQLQVFVESPTYTTLLSKIMKENQELNIADIPHIISILFDSIPLLTRYIKNGNEKTIKYVLFGILYHFIISEYPNFFDEIFTENALLILFNNCWTVLLTPADKIFKEIGKSCGCFH